MEYLVSAEEMKIADKYTSEVLGIPDVVLMERAALGCVDVIVSELTKLKVNEVTVLCGYGNNGGDGLALARMLFQKNIKPIVVMIGDSSKASRLNLLQQEILSNYGVEVTKVSPENAVDYLKQNKSSSIYIDSILGIGLNRALDDGYLSLFDYINSDSDFVFAIDVPSGLSPQNAANGKVINADITFTFGFEKLDLFLFPMKKYCGEIIKVEMGIDEFSLDGHKPKFKRITGIQDIALPHRDKGANKGTYKKLLIIAGSRDVYGALYLATRAAFSSGIGMVKVITHENNRVPLMEALPETMCSFYEDDSDLEHITLEFMNAEGWSDGIIIGPGLGFGDIAHTLVRLAVLQSNKPILIDADAIRMLSEDEELLTSLNEKNNRKVILTPHLGEFSAICNKTVAEIKLELSSIVKAYADKLKVTFICKDASSVICSYKSDQSTVNTSGTDGMATAGSGDVLAGMCGVLMVQTEDEYEAASSAAYIHGLAGKSAEEAYGSRAMVASNIIDCLNKFI